MAVELRWAVPEHTTTQAPRLQYRYRPPELWAAWGEWQDAPLVVVPQEPPNPAPAPTWDLSDVAPHRMAEALSDMSEAARGVMASHPSPTIQGVIDGMTKLIDQWHDGPNNPDMWMAAAAGALSGARALLQDAPEVANGVKGPEQSQEKKHG